MGDAAVAAPAAHHLALFSADAFHALNLRPDQAVRRIDQRVDGRLVGSLVGVRDGGEFCSGYSAPWGGPDLVRDGEGPGAVADLLATAVAALDREGVDLIRVRARPAFYSPAQPAVQAALLTLGFQVEGCELNHHVDLARFATPDDYVAALRSPARRALRHALGEPFTFAAAADARGWAAGYAVLAGNRAAKGRRLSLSLDYILAARDAFPGRIRMYLLAHRDTPCAAALVYRVLPGRDLVVAWGDSGHDLRRSPMNLLAYRVVALAMAEGLRSLDLGISSVAGVPDRGLCRFKRSILAEESLRLDLVRRRGA